MDTERLLREEEAADRLGWRRGTLANRRSRGLPPAFTKLGRSVRYREQDLQSFISAGLHEPTEYNAGEGARDSTAGSPPRGSGPHG